MSVDMWKESRSEGLHSSYLNKKEERGRRYFLSLGAGLNQSSLINAARGMGYAVIAVDQDLNAPGFAQADMQIQCSILEPRRIIRLLQENITGGNVVGVGCRSFGRAQISASLIARYFGLPSTPPSHLKIFQNKLQLKQCLRQGGIPIPQIYRCSSEQVRRRLVNYGKPIVARPVDGHAKQGVRLLKDQKDIEHFFKSELERLDQYLVEPYIRGREITVMAIVSKGRCYTISITEKFVRQEPPLFAEERHVYPARISEYLRRRIPDQMQNICDVTNLENGPLVAEFIIPEKASPNGQLLYLVECHPEIGGEFLADQLVPAVYNFNYFQALICINTGLPFTKLENIEEQQLDSSVIIRYIPQKQEGVLRHLAFPASLEQEKRLIFASLLKKAGDRVSLSSGNSDRLAVFGMQAPLRKAAELSRRVEEIAAAMQVEYLR